MKKTKLFCIAAALIIMMQITAFYCTAAEPIAATIEADGAKAGETFTVKIMLEKNDGIRSGSFNVVFDNTKLTLVEASSQTDMMSGVMNALNDKYTENSVRISFASGNAFGTNGGELMILTFTALKEGDTDISVEKLKLWSDSELLETKDTKKTITVIPGDTDVSASDDNGSGNDSSTSEVSDAVIAETEAENGNGMLRTIVAIVAVVFIAAAIWFGFILFGRSRQ